MRNNGFGRVKMLEVKDPFCIACCHREPQFCRECQEHKNWRAIPPTQKYDALGRLFSN